MASGTFRPSDRVADSSDRSPAFPRQFAYPAWPINELPMALCLPCSNAGRYDAFVEDDDIMRMTTALSTSDQRVVLQGVRWETYERLLADQQESSGTRLTYDCGTLEITSPSFGHENLNRSIARLFELLASEMEMDFLAAGSTTFRRSDLLKGFEPDSSYYIRNIDAIRNPDEIDLSVDPPPDLVIEVEVTNPVISKLPIFAAAGVPEVWLYRDDRIEVLALESGTYHQKKETSFLPGVTDSVLSEFVKSSRTMKSTAWTHSVRAWVTNR